MNKTSRLYPGHFYHIYNRGNNRENIFIEERNYSYFLSLYARYIDPIAKTYAYCLLRNHFHLLIRLRNTDEYLEPSHPHKQPSQSFSNFFNAYARTINLTYGRTGALFQRPFGRILVSSQEHLFYLVRYIHQNPGKHGFVEDYRNWPYSSYRALASDRPTKLEREEVLSWFGGHARLVEDHSYKAPEKEISYLIEEDDL
jgi:REP element-mobilizing transposase RayT